MLETPVVDVDRAPFLRQDAQLLAYAHKVLVDDFFQRLYAALGNRFETIRNERLHLGHRIRNPLCRIVIVDFFLKRRVVIFDQASKSLRQNEIHPVAGYNDQINIIIINLFIRYYLYDWLPFRWCKRDSRRSPCDAFQTICVELRPTSPTSRRRRWIFATCRRRDRECRPSSDRPSLRLREPKRSGGDSTRFLVLQFCTVRRFSFERFLFPFSVLFVSFEGRVYVRAFFSPRSTSFTSSRHRLRSSVRVSMTTSLETCRGDKFGALQRTRERSSIKELYFFLLLKLPLGSSLGETCIMSSWLLPKHTLFDCANSKERFNASLSATRLPL